jgi:hypothetical protein
MATATSRWSSARVLRHADAPRAFVQRSSQTSPRSGWQCPRASRDAAVPRSHAFTCRRLRDAAFRESQPLIAGSTQSVTAGRSSPNQSVALTSCGSAEKRRQNHGENGTVGGARVQDFALMPGHDGLTYEAAKDDGPPLAAGRHARPTQSGVRGAPMSVMPYFAKTSAMAFRSAEPFREIGPSSS